MIIDHKHMPVVDCSMAMRMTMRLRTLVAVVLVLMMGPVLMQVSVVHCFVTVLKFGFFAFGPDQQRQPAKQQNTASHP